VKLFRLLQAVELSGLVPELEESAGALNGAVLHQLDGSIKDDLLICHGENLLDLGLAPPDAVIITL
jgi:hypothetical protein